MSETSEFEAQQRRRDEEDAAVVITLLASMNRTPEPTPAERTFWGNPAFDVGPVSPQREHAWWASGLPR